MSDGLDKVAGSDTTITLNCKEYRCTRIRYGHLAEVSRHVYESRRDAMEEVAKRLNKIPEEHRQAFLDAAVRRLETKSLPEADEIRQFMSSLDGAKFLLWLMLRDNQPEFKSVADVEPVVEGIAPEELAHKIAKSSGLADLKNSSGLAASESSQAATTDPNEQRGLLTISN